VKVFDASERIASYRWLPGRAYLRYDEKWIVFKRHASPPQTKASLDSRFGTRTFLPSTLLPM
jgi:hypothetical protein